MQIPGALDQGLTLGKEALTTWGEWVSNRWEWDWWVTLTYDGAKLTPGSSTHTGVGWARSEADFHRWLLDSVGDSRGRSRLLDGVYWLRGREPNPWRYGTHFHALLGGVPTDASRRRAWELWYGRHGHARIEPYDPNRGAGFYVSKYVVKELGDIRFSDNADRFMSER